jgi:hypothetical protein
VRGVAVLEDKAIRLLCDRLDCSTSFGGVRRLLLPRELTVVNGCPVAPETTLAGLSADFTVVVSPKVIPHAGELPLVLRLRCHRAESGEQFS